MKLKENLTKLKFSSDSFFSWFLVLFWVEHTIFQYGIQVFKVLPIIGQFYEYVFPALSIMLLILSWPYLLRKIKAFDVMFYLICATIVIITIMGLSENAFYIMERWNKIFINAIPMYFIGVAYDHQLTKNRLYYASFISVVMTLLYQFYQISAGRILVADNMDSSYKLLPSIMYLLYFVFEQLNVRNIISAILGVILSFAFGTRGPILVIIVFIALAIYFKIIQAKKRWIKVVFVFGISILLFFIINVELMVSLMSSLSDYFGEIGFSTRIFEMFISGTLADDAGRDVLSNAIMEAIADKPLIGYGLMGDRVILDRYVHNIFLEMWCDFGLIVGSVIMLLLFGLYIKAMFRHRNTGSFYFILSMVCFIIIKLLLSGSFVYDQYFYLIIGICVSFCRKPMEEDVPKIE